MRSRLRAAPAATRCGAARGTARSRISPPDSSPATECSCVTSNASSRVIVGKIVASRRASIVLPAPGEPDHEQVVAAGRGDLQRPAGLCLPANLGQVHAAGFDVLRPRDLVGGGRRPGPAEEGHHLLERVGADHAQPVDERRLRRVRGGNDDATQAVASRRDRDREHARAWRRDRPASESSPANAQPATGSTGTCAEATSTPIATGRSSPGPSLRRLPGDRLTTTRRSGHSSRALSTAGRIRSRASWTAAPGRPVSVSDGSPRPMYASTMTRCPRTPTTETPLTRPYTVGGPYRPAPTP